MNTWRRHYSFGLLRFFILFLLSFCGDAGAADTPVVLGYYGNWDINARNYTVDNIPLNQLTHLDYAFIGLKYYEVGPDNDKTRYYTGELISLDQNADFAYQYPAKDGLPSASGGIARLAQYRDIKYPDLKLNFSIGGASYSWEAWTGTEKTGTGKVIGFVPDDAKRKIFVDQCVSWVSTNNFNGIDIDWEFPAIEGDKALFTKLLQELRAALDDKEKETGKYYSLSIAVGVGPDKVYHVDIPTVAGIVDHINLMTYDYAGSWTTNKNTGQKITGLNAPLYEDSTWPIWDPNMNNAAWVVNHYLNAIKDLPPETKSKLILGLPLYGKSWVNVPETNSGLFQTGIFDPNPYRKDIPKEEQELLFSYGIYGQGIIDYWGVLKLISDGGYKILWDDSAKVPYLYGPNILGSGDSMFITYDNVASIGEKLNFLKDKGLGGAMFWELSGDTRLADSPESLVSYVYKGLNSPNLILDTSQSLSSGELWSFDAIVGNTGTGTFTQSGGTHTVTYDLVLGQETGSSGTYSLANDAVLYSTNTFVGYNGSGAFTQTGGAHFANESLILAANPGSTGAYNLSGGVLYPGYTLQVGAGGTFNQTGGGVSGLLFNTAIEVSGTYNLSNDGILITGSTLKVNTGGTFNQTGGAVNGLFFSTAMDINGAYNLDGGSLIAATINLNAGGTFSQTGGSLGFTTFNQTGGTATLTDLYVGRDAGTTETYNLSGGSLATNNTYVGYFGTGIFNQTGGTQTVNNILSLGDQPGGSGTYNLSDGSLSTTNTYVGNAGTGTFTQSGGTHTVTNSLILGAGGGTGAYDLTNGTLTVGTITVASGTFTQTGGTLALTANGGTGTLGLNGGTLLNSSGTEQEPKTVTLANNITVAAGGTPTIGGNEYSSLTLTGNVSLGAGSVLTNTNLADTQFDGVISGITGRVVQNIEYGFGNLILNGANTYGGGTTWTSGILNVGSNTALGTGDLTINGGSYLGAGVAGVTLANNINTIGLCGWSISHTNDLALNGNINLGTEANGVMVVENTGHTTLTGDISGAAGIQLDCYPTAGRLTLSGNNTYTGDMTLSLGILEVASNTALGTGNLIILSDPGDYAALHAIGSRTLANRYVVTGDFAIGGATAADTLTLSGNCILMSARSKLFDTYTINLNGGGSAVLSGNIRERFGNFGITLNSTGTGSLTLSGRNAYTGDTTLTAGTLIAGSSSTADDGPFGLGTLFINGGTLYASGAQTAANAVTLGGDFNSGGALATDVLTLSGPTTLTGNRTFNVNGPGSTVFSGVIGDGGNGYGITLNSTGAGSLTLSGANTYSRGTLLTAGTLAAGIDSVSVDGVLTSGAFGTGALTINGGAIGASAPTITLTNTLATVGGDFNLGGAVTTNLELTADLNLGTHTLDHNGPSSDTLSGNVANGTIIVTAGSLNLRGTGENSAAVVAGGGLLNLAGCGATTYTGSATVTSGTLNFTGGTLSGLLTLSGGSFIMSGNAQYTNGGPLTNPVGGTLNIGTETTMNVGGGLTNNGAATVNGALTGNLTNNPGATVGGTGTITGALENHSTVNPGNSPGTLTVGTYTSYSLATQVVEIASASNYDKIVTTNNVAGAANLIGGLVSPQLLNGYLPSINTLFHVVEATGGGTVTGSFYGIDNPRVGASRTLFWQAQYTPTTADLKAVGNYTPADLALSANQRSVGHALNSLAPGTTGGDLLTVLDAINALTSDAAVAASYTEISPTKYAALSTMNFPITHMQFQYLQNRLARARWEAASGRESVNAGRGGFGRGFSFNYDSNTRMMLAASNLTISDAGARFINTGVEPRWAIYLEPNATWGSLDATANLAGYRYKNFGFTLGAEYWVLDNLLLGLNTGYSRTLGSIGGSGGDLNANVVPVNAYVAFFHKGFYANLALGYTYSSYDLQRTIAFGAINRTAQAGTSGNQFQLGAETGYDARIGNAVVGPVVSLQYATQTVAGFTESNAGALALHVSSQTADSLQSGLGVRASYHARLGNVAVKPHLAVTWQHEFSDNTRGLNAGLAAGGSTINFQTDRIGRDFALISLDLPAKLTRNLVANLGYTAEVGRNRSSNMGANIGLKLKW